MNIETIQAYLTLIKDTATCLAALVAAAVAIMGLQTWRKQLKGKTEYELAQRMLRAVYKFREALAFVRYWIMDETEMLQTGNEAKSEDVPTDMNKTFARRRKAVYQKRWQKVLEASVELDSVSLEAEAIWGPVAKESVKPLLECAGTLFATLIVYFEHIENPQTNYSKEIRSRDRKIMFGVPGEKDNFFSNQITSAVKKAEDFLKPYLKI